MQFTNLIQSRQSIRAFLDRPVEQEKIRQILETANQAPSAGNLQAFEIFVIDDEPSKRTLALAALGQDFVASAPVVLVFCSHPSRSERKYRERGANLYALQDATIACTFALLAATDAGLATVWVGAFDESAVLNVLHNPEGLRPVAVLPIGYPAEQPEPTRRRPLTQIVHRIQQA